MFTHRQILKNELLDKELKENGYVVIPFLNHEEQAGLLNVFDTIPKEEIRHFYATAHSPDLAFRNRMSQAIKQGMKRSLEEWMVECDALGGSFIVKAPGGSDVLQPHQDWNIVNEDYFRSFNVWIPLVDLNESNGTILVMPGSHKWVRSYRHSSIPCAFEQVHLLLLQHMIPLYLKAGEALIYDHALLHASQPNKSNQMRIACASGVKPAEAEMFFYWNNNGTIEKYHSSPEFFMQENVFEGPKGLKKKGDVDYNIFFVSDNEFYKLSGIEKKTIKEEYVENKAITKLPKPSFFQIYTPLNVLREIKLRLIGK